MIKLYRVSSKENESDTWSDESRFFTTDKNYYEHSMTGYDATILPDILSDYGYGQPFTEYVINNSKYLKRNN